jgi:hypothetical protein
MVGDPCYLAFEREGQLADLVEAHHQLDVALQRMHEPTTSWPETVQGALQGRGIFGQENYWPVPALQLLEEAAERLALTDAVIKELAN